MKKQNVNPKNDNQNDDEEYDAAADAFDEYLDDQMFDGLQWCSFDCPE